MAWIKTAIASTNKSKRPGESSFPLNVLLSALPGRHDFARSALNRFNNLSPSREFNLKSVVFPNSPGLPVEGCAACYP